MPGNYDDGSFTSCEGELQDVVGVYTGADGQSAPPPSPPPLCADDAPAATTWEQTRPVATIPYTPRIPASSACRTFSSDALFGAVRPPPLPLPPPLPRLTL